MSRETRTVRAYAPESAIELRDGDKPVISGYAAVFDSLSVDLGGFRERIRPGAFARAIKENQDVRALVNHDPNLILGRSKSGTLRLSEDQRGLRVEIDPPATTVGRDVVESLRRGDLDQMSFAFRVVTDDWHKQDGEIIRELVDVDLFDVSPVAFPAYEETSVSVRSKVEELSKPAVPPPSVFTERDLRRLQLAEKS